VLSRSKTSVRSRPLVGGSSITFLIRIVENLGAGNVCAACGCRTTAFDHKDIGDELSAALRPSPSLAPISRFSGLRWPPPYRINCSANCGVPVYRWAGWYGVCADVSQRYRRRWRQSSERPPRLARLEWRSPGERSTLPDRTFSSTPIGSHPRCDRCLPEKIARFRIRYRKCRTDECDSKLFYNSGGRERQDNVASFWF
jgi:hypothetical protein